MTQRITVDEIRARKGDAQAIVMLTAYTAPITQQLDQHCDMLLVGDSLAMVIYGLETTRGVTLDIMIAHGRAVTRASKHACIVVDLPHGTYEQGPAQALESARRVIEDTQCQAIKLEGGVDVAPTIKHLVEHGIPVLGHIGLLPQKAEYRGAFKIQGRDDEGAQKVMADAHAVADAGAFAVVIEGTVEPLAHAITKDIDIPTIGIGASPACDGQVLVTDDMIGLYSEFTPKFVKQYAHVAKVVSDAAKAYAQEVRSRKFPGLEHCFGVQKPKPEA